MKKILALVLALIMVFTLVACGAKEEPEAEEVASATETVAEEPYVATGEGDYSGHTLVVANWQGYCFDADYVLKAFEKQFGCEVEMVYFDSYDDLMTRIQTGDKIDVANVSQNYTQYFHDLGIIETLDASQVPNYALVDDAYRDVSPYFIDDEGGVFAFPWCFGVTSLCYNPELCPIEIEHWSDLLDPALEGHVCLYQDYGDGMIIGSLISGQDPAYPESLDLDAVRESLSALKTNILSFWGSYDDIENPYRAGEFWVGNMWSGAYVDLLNDGYPIKVVHPEEGTVGYIDACVVVKDTEEYELAVEWCNWLESYEIQHTMATTEGSEYDPEDWGNMAYPPVNAQALSELTEEQATVLYLNPLPTKVCMLNYLTADQKDAWVDLWNDIKAE